ncbi:hypothetical protein ACFLU6_07365 [Acidobacteriota bacterium]
MDSGNPRDEKAQFQPGDNVRVTRDDGRIEDGWHFAVYDPENNNAVVVRLHVSGGHILHQVVPWSEFSELNKVPVSLGDMVIVKREAGQVEGGWEYAGRNPDSNNAIVVRPEVQGEILIKEVPWQDFIALNRMGSDTTVSI